MVLLLDTNICLYLIREKPPSILERFNEHVVALDRSATVVYGKLRTTLDKKGQSIGAMDLLIAAHALALNVRLVTHNVREFGRVPGLRVETR